MSQRLEGIKVIEVGGTVAMPLAGMLMASWGAEVIHVEPPQMGDMLRYISSRLLTEEANPHQINYLWEHVDRNKKSIAINLRSVEGQAVIHKLVATADVFVSNLRPYEAERYNLSYNMLSNINPKIIYANLTGFGQQGPEKNAGGYDTVAFWARSGVMELMRDEGSPPIISRPAYGDSITALPLLAGIMSALFIRERSGEGQEVAISLFNTAAWVLGFDISGTLISNENPPQSRLLTAINPLRNVYQTKDNRWIMLGMTQPQPYWLAFCEAIDRQDLVNNPKYSTAEERTTHVHELADIIQTVFGGKTLAEWKAVLSKYKLIWAPAQMPTEVIEDKQALANDFFIEWNHPDYGTMRVLNNPIKLSKTSAEITRRAPELGEHTEAILRELGYTKDQMKGMKESGIIG